MTETIKNCNSIVMFTLGALLVVVLALFLRGANTTQGAQVGNLDPRQSTTTVYILANTTPAVGSNPLVATSTGFCSARVITTATSSIRMIIGNHQGHRPTYGKGIFQATSTTVVYGAENHGCGAVWAMSEGVASTITVTETY